MVEIKCGVLSAVRKVYKFSNCPALCRGRKWQARAGAKPAISGPSVLRAPQDAFWLAVFSPFPALGAGGVADGACPIASATLPLRVTAVMFDDVVSIFLFRR